MSARASPPPTAAVELARHVSATSGLRFDGLMGYEGHTLMIPDPAEKRSAITTGDRQAAHRPAMPSSPSV